MNTPSEVKEIINRDYAGNQLIEVRNKIEEIYNTNWNVGQNQLARSLLYLSKGSLEKFNSFFPIIDPRDIVMEADLIQDSKENYF